MTENQPFASQSQGSGYFARRYEQQQQQQQEEEERLHSGFLHSLTANKAWPERPQRKGVHYHAQTIAVLVLVPLACFMISMWTTAFLLQNFPVTAYVIMFTCLAAAFLMLYLYHAHGENRIYLYAGILMLIATICGRQFGKAVNDTLLSRYLAQAGHASYKGVSPTSLAAAYADAARIGFTSDTRVDLRRTVGFKVLGGSTYCAAPVLDDTDLTRVEFFAVGLDCCEARWDFRCGESTNTQAHAGIVVSGDGASKEATDRFIMAAKQAAGIYRFHIPNRPVFVEWVADMDNAAGHSLTSAILTMILLSFIAALLLLLVASIMHWSSAHARPAGMAWNDRSVI